MPPNDNQSTDESTSGYRSWLTRRETMAGAAGLAGGAMVPAFSTTAAATAPIDGGATEYDGLAITRSGRWDYAPTAMTDTDYVVMWWCGENSDSTDSIYYSELQSSGWTDPIEVMSPSSSDWDSNHTCDPSVVKGTFNVDGGTYDYALYYTGTKNATTENSIGVAFSNDRTTWHKYSNNPVITSAGDDSNEYGTGMPTAYREPGTDDTVTVAFFDSTDDGASNHFATATDAVSFGSRTDLTSDPRTDAMIGSIAYVPEHDIWYVSTKQYTDEKMYLYKTQNSGLNSTWKKCAEFVADQTGNPKNHNPGWLRKPNGDIHEESTTAYEYFYFGTGGSDNDTWDLGQARYLDGWEFDVDGDKEGWISANVSGDSDEPTDGSWKCTADQDDPQFVSPEVAIDAAATGTVRVYISNYNNDSNGKIYFKRYSDSGFSESRSVEFTVQTDGSWDEYAVDMSSNSYWTDTVSHIRIDPISSGTGDVLGIGYVRLDS